MITHTKQSWNVGDKVNIGFIKGLTVLSVRAEKAGLPDIYTLEGKESRLYEFIPHNGITRIN